MKTTEEQKLEFLDDILKYLANEKSENVVLQNIVTNVGYDKLNSSVFTHLPKFNLQTDQLNFFFSKAMKHLINEKLVDGLINGSEIYYTITFKGLLHIYGGGFIKPNNLKKEEIKSQLPLLRGADRRGVLYLLSKFYQHHPLINRLAFLYFNRCDDTIYR